MRRSRPVHDSLLGALACLSVWSAAPAAAAGDGLSNAAEIANAIRATGCGQQPGVEQPLRPASELDAVARGVADGDSLEDALSARRYRASRATVLHIEARSGSGAIEKFLSGQFCTTVTDPELEELGTATRGHEVWLVLATPLSFPDAHDRAAVRTRVLELTNQARARARTCGLRSFAAVGPLTASPLLDQAAQRHADDIAARGVLSHLGRDGSNVRERVTRDGYAWRAVAENVAEGQPSAYVVVRDWLDSPEHCTNLMGADYTEMGVAFAIGEQGGGPAYWVQVFAAPR